MLADAIVEGLRREAMAVDVAYDGVDAGERLAVNDYDVVVLDRDLPGVSGDDLCRSLVSANSPARVLMLTAAAAVNQRVAGLSLGADDYLGKPFDFTELVARIRALGRRTQQPLSPVLCRRTSSSTPTGARCCAVAGTFACPARSSPCWRNCCGPPVPS